LGYKLTHLNGNITVVSIFRWQDYTIQAVVMSAQFGFATTFASLQEHIC